MPAIAEELEAARENAELRQALSRALRANQRLKAKQADLVEAVLTAAKDAALVVGTQPPIAGPPRDRRRSPEVALLHFTDWHVGKRTPTFDTDVCKARVTAATEKTLKLSAIQRADHPVRECVVMLGGDLVENLGIFPGQAYEVDSSAYVQLFEAAALLERVLLSLLGPEGFEKVTVYEVPGNHGRIGRRGDHPRDDNLDRIVCRIARERLAAQPRLAWSEPSGWYEIVEIGAYRAMLVHGDQVRSYGGNTPMQGLLKKANAWAAGGVPDSFHDLYVGHLHQPMVLQLANGGLVYMTPSPESSSAYAQEFMASHGRPGQRLHFIDPRRGRVTGEYLLHLES